MTSILSLFEFQGRQAEAVGSSADRASDSPTVVTAGAGSGKTLTLVGRYVRLLEQRVPLRAIAAISFTEKAAREMRTRIRQTVDRWSARCAEVDRAYWQAVSAELDAARIGTIHGLCATLLRGHPAEVGLDPEFDVLDENQAARLRAEAVDTALAWAAAEATAAQIFRTLSEQAARELMDDWLGARSDALAAFERLSGDPLNGWSTVLNRWLSEQLGQSAWGDAVYEITAICRQECQRQTGDQPARRRHCGPGGRTSLKTRGFPNNANPVSGAAQQFENQCRRERQLGRR